MTGITYLLSLTFSIQDYAKLANTRTGLPLAEIFRQATQSVGGAFALTLILWVAIGPCMVGSQLSMRLSTFRYLHTMRYLMRFCFFRYRSSLLGFRQRWGSAAVKSVRPAQAVGKLFFSRINHTDTIHQLVQSQPQARRAVQRSVLRDRDHRPAGLHLPRLQHSLQCHDEFCCVSTYLPT